MFFAGTHEFGLSPRSDLASRERRIEGEPEFGVVKGGPQAEIALGSRQEFLFEPDLVLRYGRARVCDGGSQGGLVGIRQNAELRHDQLIDQCQHAGVLFERGLGVDPGNTLGHQRLAYLCEKAWQFREAGADDAQPVRQRSEVPGQQQIKTVAGKLGVDEWVPTPLGQLLYTPDLVLELIRQKTRIDLIRA